MEVYPMKAAFLGGFIMPPLAWLLVIWYSGLFNVHETLAVATNPILFIYVVAFVAIVFFVACRHISQIDAFLKSRDTNLMPAAQRAISALPILFMAAEAIYCLIGPNTGLWGLNFVGFKEWLLAWLFGLPIMTILSCPFFMVFVKLLENFTYKIPMEHNHYLVSFRARSVLVTAINSLGAVMFCAILACSLIYKNPAITLGEFAMKVTTMALICMGAVFVSATVAFGAIIRPIRRAAEIARSGDISLRLNMTLRDEIGALGRAFDSMTARLQRKAEEAAALASGDLTIEVDVASEPGRSWQCFQAHIG